jgi:hypothetical protein
MMLPEHIRAYNVNKLESKARIKPTLDIDEIETIERAISESLGRHIPITLHMFDLYEDLRVIGIVERIAWHTRRVYVDGEWFRLDDVIGVES